MRRPLSRSGRNTLASLIAAFLLLATGGACVAFWRMRAVLELARRAAAHEGHIGFSLRPLEGSVASGFEPVTDGRDGDVRAAMGIAAGGRMYLAGPGGMAVYASSTAAPKLLRAGLELPPAPVVALTAGKLRGASGVQVVAATHGEGVVLVSADDTRPAQLLRADDAAARDVTAVLALASGELLLGTARDGVLVYDGETLRPFAAATSNLPVTALAADEGGFWVGTRDRGLLHCHGGQVDAVGVGDGLPDAEIDDIAAGPEGVFAATPLGVAALQHGKPVRTLVPGTFAHRLALNGDTLLVATLEEGIETVELGTRRSPRGPPPQAVTQAATSHAASFFRAGGEWLAVSEGRLLRLDHGDWTEALPTAPHLLSDRNISSLHMGPDGRLWVGTFDHGLDIVDLTSQSAVHVEDDHVFCVNRIVADPLHNSIDIATANGLVLFDAAAPEPRERQVLLRRDGLLSDQVYDVAFTADTMTAATAAGLTMFSPRGAESLYAFQGLVNNHVYTLAAAQDGHGARLLAGTLGGISVLEGGSVRANVTLKNSALKRNWITALVRLPARDARWLVGTYGGGVVEMNDAGQVSEMDGMDRAAVINPNALLVTPQHVLAGSLSGGLLVYSRASQRWTALAAGLPSRNVTALAAANGEIYVGTDNGLVRMAEGRLP